jgi:HK97 family phage portal protein
MAQGVAGMLQRIFAQRVPRPQTKAAPVTQSTGGYIPPTWPVNFWQLGWDPLRAGGGAIVYSCIACYSQTAAMCPPSHWRSTGDGGRERVTNSALSRVMRQPNAYQSGSDFVLNLVGALYSDGNAYAYATRNNRYEVAELHLMDSATSGAYVASNGEVFYSIGGNPIVERLLTKEAAKAIPARDVLHLKLDARGGNPLKGEPPLTNAMMDIAASNSMVRQALDFANNAAKPSGVLTTDQPLEDWQTKEMREMWREVTTGRNAGGTPILSNGLKWQQVSSTSRDAQLAELLQISDGRIATAYRIPLPLLSLWGAQVQAGGEDLMRFWVSSAFGFALNHVEDGVGRFFGLSGWPQEYLEFDTAALLRSSQLNRIEALARGVQGGIYSPNEARALEDLPAAEDGDQPRVQQQVVPLDAWSQQQPQTPRPDAPNAPPTVDASANENAAPDTAAAKSAGIAAMRRRHYGGT